MVHDCQELDAQMPPVRIQGAQHGFTVVSQLRGLMKGAGGAPVTYRYVKTDLPIRNALDQDVLDFAIHLEATPDMQEYAAPDLREQYGWIPLRPERFAHYYHDLDAEESSTVRVREFEPIFYPFLVYRRDSEAPGVQVIAKAYEEKEAASSN